MVGIRETRDTLYKNHERFIEASYHIHDEELINKRKNLIRSETNSGVWIEKIPRYATGPRIEESNLPDAVKDILIRFSNEKLGVYNPPYTHQSEALDAFFNEGKNVVVSTGTGSGKTEAFLYSILGMIAQEGKRNVTTDERGMRAMILYPMNSLVSDQLSRLRRMIGKDGGKRILKTHFGRTVQFGMFTSRTPYYGPRLPAKNRSRIKPVIDHYMKLRRNDLETYQELDKMGRIPTKDLDNYSKKFETQQDDAELFSRQEMYDPNEYGGTPDILITNYSMLEYMLLREIEQPILDDTKRWLNSDDENKLLLVIDEAHLYYGSQGAEVSMLISRLLMRLGIERDKIKFILTSASLGDENDAVKNGRDFASDLTGAPKDSFVVLRGKRETNSAAAQNGDDGPEATPSFQRMISLLNERAQSIETLGKEIFPELDKEVAEDKAIDLVDDALRIGGNTPKYSMKAHIFFRGMDKQYICLNPDCGHGKYGKMYMGIRDVCDCGSRTYELLTHRTCGAAYIRGFIYKDSIDHTNDFFLWNKGGNDFTETHVLIQNTDSLKTDAFKKMFMDFKTGFVTKTQQNGFIEVYVPNIKADGSKKRKVCPICGEAADKKIMDLETKGEEVFSNLIKTLFELQPQTDSDSPNRGRKVLCFSDSRKKAAKLAKDIQTNIEQEAFKEVLVAVCSENKPKNMSDLFPLFTDYCYRNRISFFDDSDESDGDGSRSTFENIKNDYGVNGPSDEYFDDEKRVPQYHQRLLKAIGDSNYSLTASLVGIILPTNEKIEEVCRELQTTDKEFIVTVLTYVIWEALKKRAYDKRIGGENRKKSRQTRNDPYGNRGLEGVGYLDIVPEKLKKLYPDKDGTFWEDLKNSIVKSKIFENTKDNTEQYFISPKNVQLSFKLSEKWYKCGSCRSFLPCDTNGKCPSCGGKIFTYDSSAPDPHTDSRKSLFREPYREIIDGRRKPFNIRSEEHSAQLSYRDEAEPLSRTENYELSFQDILLEDGDKTTQPIDVLSCTTTMEVGIDIGSLTAVALRTIPPRSDNYQQRSGRAGRRKSSLSTVISYADNKPYELGHFKNPDGLVNGRGRKPIIYIGNKKICERHTNASILNKFFFEINSRSGGNILEAMGKCKDFFDDEEKFTGFSNWIEAITSGEDTFVCDLGKRLPSELRKSLKYCNEEEWGKIFIQETATSLLEKFKDMKEHKKYDADEELIKVLLDAGILPSFSFPLDVGKFTVHSKKGWKKIDYEPSENLKQALNDYVPGKEIIIDKKTFECRGVTFPYSNGEDRAVDRINTKPIKICMNEGCDSMVYGVGVQDCILCGGTLNEVQVFRPEAFSPEFGKKSERINDDEYTITSAAALPIEEYTIEKDPDDKKSVEKIQVERGYNVSLKVINYGLEREGFKICKKCGRIEHAIDNMENWHSKTYSTSRCKITNADVQRVMLGYDLITDIVSFKIIGDHNLSFDHSKPWVKAAAVSLKEGLIMAAAKELEIDPRELSGGYRLIRNETNSKTILEIFLYDTTPSGAGFSSAIFNDIENILKKTEELLEDCTCDSSCQICMRTYENKFHHDILDRKMALSLLHYAKYHEILPIAPEKLNHLKEIFKVSLSELMPKSTIEVLERGLRVNYGKRSASLTFSPFLEDKCYSSTGQHISDFEAQIRLPELLGKICTGLQS